MAQALRNRRWYRYLSHICRILFAVTFIVSGFYKAIDPWGTILVMRNYLVAYDLAAPDWLVTTLSIWLSCAELMMGCMLLFKVRIRMASVFALLSMIFFTVLTLLSATVVPVEDCGCFGELVKLSPWQTFAKNAVLLPMALCFWYRYRPDRIFAFSKLEFVLMCSFFTMAMSVGVYSYRHLPIVDMLPYKVGTNIADEMQQAQNRESSEEVVLVYRNRRTGRLREFSVDDKAWHNDKRWVWVETRVTEDKNSIEPMILEFYISNTEGDKTADILSYQGKTYMLFMAQTDLPEAVRKIFDAVESQALMEGSRVVYITPEHLAADAPAHLYNMDSKTMKTILRADYGLVELEGGTIVAKYNYRDILPPSALHRFM